MSWCSSWLVHLVTEHNVDRHCTGTMSLELSTNRLGFVVAPPACMYLIDGWASFR